MNFRELLELLEKGENISNLTSGVIGNTSGILNMLGIGRRRQIRQQKEMMENAAKINYKYGEMAAENAFERQGPTKTKATPARSRKWMQLDYLLV